LWGLWWSNKVKINETLHFVNWWTTLQQSQSLVVKFWDFLVQGRLENSLKFRFFKIWPQLNVISNWQITRSAMFLIFVLVAITISFRILISYSKKWGLDTRSKDKLPLVVHHRAVEDMAEDHMEQRCFYNKDLDMGKLLVPSIQKKKKRQKSVCQSA
jgi:hypothetical protein